MSAAILKLTFMNLDEVRNFWAKVLGSSGPEWMIVMALQHLDEGEGSSVQAIADMLRVNRTFVISQSRFPTNRGLIRESAAGENGAAAQLSLTDQARRHH